MSDSTVFYTVGTVLAASAVLVTVLGLRSERFPGRMAPLIALWFVVLVGGATTFAVLNAKHEQHAESRPSLAE